MSFDECHLEQLTPERLEARDRVIITVRDPVDRLISAFNWRSPKKCLCVSECSRRRQLVMDNRGKINSSDVCGADAQRGNHYERDFYACFKDVQDFASALLDEGKHSPKCKDMARVMKQVGAPARTKRGSRRRLYASSADPRKPRRNVERARPRTQGSLVGTSRGPSPQVEGDEASSSHFRTGLVWYRRPRRNVARWSWLCYALRQNDASGPTLQK